jgi:hypothetical protein
MSTEDKDRPATEHPESRASEATRHPEQEHPPQDAHGGSMAPGLVDDTGHPLDNQPPGAVES